MRNVKGRRELASLKQSLPTVLSCVSDADWTTGHCHPTGCVPSTLLHRQCSKVQEAVGLTQSRCEMMSQDAKPDSQLRLLQQHSALDEIQDLPLARPVTSFFSEPQFVHLQMNVCSVISDSSQPQAPLSMGFPRQDYWNGLPFPSPGDLPDPGIEPTSLDIPAWAGRFFTTSTTWEGR